VPKAGIFIVSLSFILAMISFFTTSPFIPFVFGNTPEKKAAFNPGVADFTFIAGCHLPCFTCT
jgi:hypothetical protein